VLAVPVIKYVLPQAMKQQLVDKYINKIIYSDCQLIRTREMALFVTSNTSCKTRNTLWAQNIDSGEKGEKLILCLCFVYVYCRHKQRYQLTDISGVKGTLQATPQAQVNTNSKQQLKNI
jgi:hypothetical protein